MERSVHVRYVACVPGIDVRIEGKRVTEHLLHIGNRGGVPVHRRTVKFVA